MKSLPVLILATALCACASLAELDAELFRAAGVGDVPKIKALLEQGARVDGPPDSIRMRALSVAMDNGRLDAVRTLLEHGASPNRRRLEFIAPLQLAMQKRDIALAELLLAKGADPSVRDTFWDTPLHVSVYRADQAFSDLLRRFKADEARANRFGLVPREMRELPPLQEKLVTTASFMAPSGAWTDVASAKPLFDELRAREPRFLINAASLEIAYGAASTRRNVLKLVIKLGLPGTEDHLSYTLLHISKERWMAEDYLNSDSHALQTAARAWAQSEGYQIYQLMHSSGQSRSTWGRF